MPPPPLPIPGDLLLKVTPPQAPRQLVPRQSLGLDAQQVAGRQVLLVQAPAGFGKTSLLAQWRRELLARGAVVGWLTGQPQDEPRRFVQGLALAVRVAAGRPTFGHVLLEAAPPSALEGITLWLAEVAQSALDVVVVVDEADRLPAAARESLVYLLHNAPPNLRVIVAARPDCDFGIADLVAYGQCATVGAMQLRFTLAETLALARVRMAARFNADEAARLHETTEGWPLGLQLALSVADTPGGNLPRLDLHGGALQEQFIAALLRNLDPADVDFLVRVSVADPLHPGLCAALVPGTDTPARLQRLLRDTPVLVAGERSDWMRMHSLARTVLHRRLAELPEAERSALHHAAAAWLAAQGLIESAARHALAAGEHQRAYELAERSLYEALMQRGRQGSVIEWITQLPAAQLDARPRLMLAAAWSLALSERHPQAQAMVDRILAQPNVDAGLRCECALILGGAAVFADDPDRFAQLHDPWAQDPPLREASLLQVHANRSAFRALVAGEPALARLRQQQGPHAEGGYLDRWGEFVNALAYLWEGQVVLADNLLRPALAAAEGDLGRRNPFAAMLASLLAAASWEQDRGEEALTLLANRLDVLERSALPECVMLAYRTMARIASAGGQEHRALEMLEALDAVGISRGLPRLRVASLTEQVRLHAGRFRSQTCRDLCARLDALVAQESASRGPLWGSSVELLQAVAHGHAQIGARAWRAALEPLARADAHAQRIRQGRLHIELLGLRAYAMDRCGEREALPLLHEAGDLAAAYGLRRVFVDAHPDLGRWAAEVLAPQASVPVARAPASRPDAALRAAPSMALTPKEREVLELLARNLSNKEVALALHVGEETIKWHVKNLFAKLDAGTRKQVVGRARILGLLADG